MISVGMDVHVRNTFVHARDAEGNVIRSGRCGNTLMDFCEHLAPVERQATERGERVRVVLESTTNSRAVQRLLTQYGASAGMDLTAEVLDARKIRIIAESVCKCDRLDSAVLCELASSNLKLPVCYMPDDEEFALREYLRARNDLVRMRTMLKNRVHAVLHRRGILSPKQLFTFTGRAFLASLDVDESGRDILDRYLDMVDQMDRTIDESTASLRTLARRPRWSKHVTLLQTMPGIGLITSLTILAELGDLARFHSRAAVANYAGLVPVVRDSNSSHYRGGITHRGSKHLRAVLVEAAWISVSRVPVYRHLFDRIEQKKNKPTAIVAVARRMLEDAFTLLIRDEAFRYAEAPVMPDAPAPRCGCEVASSVAG
jgi:transposase